MTKNNYNIEKIIDALNNKKYTNFLTQKELMQVKGRLNKDEYKIYELYQDGNKIILYKKDVPAIKLFKIVAKVSLRHQDILGTIFSLGITEDTFGDIVKYQDNFYIFLLPHLEDYFKYNFVEIKGNPIGLEEVDIDLALNFKQEYSFKEYIVSSLRIDNVVSSITNESRNEVLDHFKNKEVILNYTEELKPTRLLHENDVFSIRKFGKYKFLGVIKTTKKGGFIVKIAKYV